MSILNKKIIKEKHLCVVIKPKNLKFCSVMLHHDLKKKNLLASWSHKTQYKLSMWPESLMLQGSAMSKKLPQWKSIATYFIIMMIIIWTEFKHSNSLLVKVYRLLSKGIQTVHCPDILNVIQRNPHSHLQDRTKSTWGTSAEIISTLPSSTSYYDAICFAGFTFCMIIN